MSGKNWSTTESSFGNSAMLSRNSSSSSNNANVIPTSAFSATSGNSARDFNNAYIRDYNDYIFDINKNSARESYNLNYKNFIENRKYNTDLFYKALAYDKEMSNTAIRRQMQDLKAAGLNPILAARYGGAAYHSASVPYDYSVPIYNIPVMQMPQFDLNNYYGTDSSFVNAMLNYESNNLDRFSKELMQDKQIQADLNYLFEEYKEKKSVLANEYKYDLKKIEKQQNYDYLLQDLKQQYYAKESELDRQAQKDIALIGGTANISSSFIRMLPSVFAP